MPSNRLAAGGRQTTSYFSLRQNRPRILGLYVTIMLLWSIEPKIDRNRLLPTIKFKNLVAIMIVGNSGVQM